jgi:hypothetical protein
MVCLAINGRLYINNNYQLKGLIMAARSEDMRFVREYDRMTLARCGKNWSLDSNMALFQETDFVRGNDQDFSDDMFDTSIDGVIGISGRKESSKGPGFILRNIDSSEIDMVWTDSLQGCMGLAIYGRNKETGSVDVFFGHARRYDAPDATTDAQNPMSLAKRFVDSHTQLRVFWGTDFLAQVGGDTNQMRSAQDYAQQVLSSKLGIWCNNEDRMFGKELAFLPKLGLMRPGTPNEVFADINQMSDNELQSRRAYSASKALEPFHPNSDILGRLQLKHEELKVTSMFNPHKQRRNFKLKVIDAVIKAYKVGNFDILRTFQRSAVAGTAPFGDKDSVSAWKAMGESEVKGLCIEAYDDALGKIRALEQLGCGLRENGEGYYDHRSYTQAQRQQQDDTSNEGIHMS